MFGFGGKKKKQANRKASLSKPVQPKATDTPVIKPPLSPEENLAKMGGAEEVAKIIRSMMAGES